MSLRATVAADRGSFEVRAAIAAQEGETLALLGPNGAGKTTVVLALAGLIESTGAIELGDERIVAWLIVHGLAVSPPPDLDV